MIWSMKKADPTPWRKVRENLWEPGAIVLFAKSSAAEGWLPRLFFSPPLHFCSRVCGDDFKEHSPWAGSFVLGLYWRQEGWKKKEGEREESLARLVWRGGEVGWERCPASWHWRESLSSPVCRAAHTENQCEKSHYPAGKYLMDHGGRNAKARRGREGGKGQATSSSNPCLREGQYIAGAGTRWVCGHSYPSPEEWVQVWEAIFSPQCKISQQCHAEVSGCCSKSDSALVRAEVKCQKAWDPGDQASLKNSTGMD